jgi:hypothetical protein
VWRSAARKCRGAKCLQLVPRGILLVCGRRLRADGRWRAGRRLGWLARHTVRSFSGRFHHLEPHYFLIVALPECIFIRPLLASTTQLITRSAYISQSKRPNALALALGPIQCLTHFTITPMQEPR